MDGFFRILKKAVSELICTRLYFLLIFLKDPTSPLSREEQQKKVWQAQSNKNVLVKKTMDAIFPYVSQHFNIFLSKFLILITLNLLTFFFLKDPTSSLSKEEQQKKAWQAQSQKNILVKKTMEAIGWKYVSQHLTKTIFYHDLLFW
jgi:hypothetical protein